MTLPEVIQGLKNGKSYRREVAGIVDTLRPNGDGNVLHTVVNNRTGAGGECDIPILILHSGNWPTTNWFEIRPAGQ